MKDGASFCSSHAKAMSLSPAWWRLEILTGLKEGEAMLDELLKLGPTQVVVKAGDKGAWNGTAQNAILSLLLCSRDRSRGLAMRSAQDSFPDCSMVGALREAVQRARRSARSAFLLLATTRACPLGLSSSLHGRKGCTGPMTHIRSRDPAHALT